MGSMCYTELWPKQLSQKIEKTLVKGGDYVKMNGGARDFETVYRPKKWHQQDGIKKKMAGTIQASKNGHENLVRSSRPNQRSMTAIAQQKLQKS